MWYIKILSHSEDGGVTVKTRYPMAFASELEARSVAEKRYPQDQRDPVEYEIVEEDESTFSKEAKLYFDA